MRWRMLTLGIALYAVALVATAPATMLDARLAHESHGRIRLADCRGTLWSGVARLEVRDGEGRSAYGSAVSWQLSPASLLQARLVYDVALGRPAADFRLSVSPSRIRISRTAIRLPAEVLGLAARELAVLDLRGELQLQVDDLVVGEGYLRGDATLRWLNAGSGLTRVSPLGTYELRIDANGTTGRVRLRTLQGPLRLEGGTDWRSGRVPALAAIAQVPPEYRDQLSPLLRLIGVERGPGRFELRLN